MSFSRIMLIALCAGVVLLPSLGVSSTTTSAPSYPVFDLSTAQAVSVVEVVDGDTIKVGSSWGTTTIRLGSVSF